MVPSPTVDAETVTVRQATRPDLLSIHRLEKRVFDEPWSYAVFEEFLGEPAFLVADLDGRLLGYVVADRTANNGRDFGHVKDLAVDPEAQRNGIGRLLLRQAVSRLLVEGVVRIKLEVREHNTAARRLYAQEGFEPRKRIPRYYHDGEAALVLVYESRR
ncbi:ribosomal protein S18-alanine N-acetyltransferase [Halohasta salina]|uniref:ribosomal protein S18-alanine N-acetyltransferase n=1 Tax=Halohasta salina TaxID=2961621 RepID=UPI0020A57DE4|nr:ribosomal protein S18-alanine N-acetyltransferase [Halohasta salina]